MLHFHIFFAVASSLLKLTNSLAKLKAILKTEGTVFPIRNALGRQIAFYLFLFYFAHKKGITTNPPRLADKIVKLHPLSEPIRLHDLENPAHSRSEKIYITILIRVLADKKTKAPTYHCKIK